ncbi:UDP-glucuronosyl/UDP-glucosyltransferase [Corchorus capsularis]|uniref:UDP-glucuronosyl/UDP-glucosyltransferase n=1 Tax=Corchorus capsularis TaxID=210143 RepID=A0A1R3KWX9_COCAP|nr:UDP-glucuronosyl/UDP-glucosyltransferase [Corchorus capsularis]
MGAKCTLKAKKPKIILVPYPAQGHVTPMLKLGSALLSHGFEPIVVTPEFIHHRIAANMDPIDEIRFMSIPDGLEQEGPHDFFAIEKAMENIMPTHLEGLIHKVDEEEEGEDGRVVCMVIDLLASWAIEVANRCRIPAAGFWTAMQATYRLIAAIPEMVHSGLISKTGSAYAINRRPSMANWNPSCKKSKIQILDSNFRTFNISSMAPH